MNIAFILLVIESCNKALTIVYFIYLLYRSIFFCEISLTEQHLLNLYIPWKRVRCPICWLCWYMCTCYVMMLGTYGMWRCEDRFAQFAMKCFVFQLDCTCFYQDVNPMKNSQYIDSSCSLCGYVSETFLCCHWTLPYLFTWLKVSRWTKVSWRRMCANCFISSPPLHTCIIFYDIVS